MYFCYILKKYLHSFIQFAVFTGCVARETNRLYVLRMIVKLSGEAREAAYILPQSPERVVLLAVRVPNFDVVRSVCLFYLSIFSILSVK